MVEMKEINKISVIKIENTMYWLLNIMPAIIPPMGIKLIKNISLRIFLGFSYKPF